MDVIGRDSGVVEHHPPGVGHADEADAHRAVLATAAGSCATYDGAYRSATSYRSPYYSPYYYDPFYYDPFFYNHHNPYYAGWYGLHAGNDTHDVLFANNYVHDVKNGIVVLIPSTWYSISARCMRAMMSCCWPSARSVASASGATRQRPGRTSCARPSRCSSTSARSASASD